MKSKVFGAATLFVSTLLVGCGGGSPIASRSESELDNGFVTTRAVGSVGPPVTLSNGTVTVSGFAGASFTLARINLPPLTALNRQEAQDSTQVAMMRADGTPWLLDVRDGRLSQLVLGAKNTLVKSPPSFFPTGDRILSSEVDTGSGFMQIFSTSVDGSARTNISPSGSSYLYPAVSPNGQKVLVCRPTNGVYQLYLLTLSNGTLAQLTFDPASKTFPQWSPDGNRILYTATTNFVGKVMIANADASNPIAATSTGGNHTCGTWSPDGTELAIVFNDGTTKIGRARPGEALKTFFSTPDEVHGVTWSPDGGAIAFTQGDASGGVPKRFDLPSGTASALSPVGGMFAPSWGPYVRQRTLIGNGGVTGAGAGFLLPQIGTHIPGWVVFDATTRNGVTVTKEPATQGQRNLVFVVQASDSLTMLRYGNHLLAQPVNAISSGAPVSGALVSFDGQSGKVVNVLPYIGAAPVRKGDGRYEGHFVGWFDADGKNRAPSGLAAVRM